MSQFGGGFQQSRGSIVSQSSRRSTPAFTQFTQPRETSMDKIKRVINGIIGCPRLSMRKVIDKCGQKRKF